MTHSNPEQEMVLSLLDASGEKMVPINDIAAAIGSDIRGALGTLQSLRRYGYQVKRRGKLGYRLGGGATIPHPWQIRKQLRTKFIGRRIFAHSFKTESTQKAAIEIGESKSQDAHGCVIIAEQQTAGRGRASRKWISPLGGVWMSIVFKPEFSAENCTLLPFAGALATLSAIRSYAGITPWLKWPNDVFVGRKKIAGILGDMALEENRVKWAVLGIGINANMDAKSLDVMRRQAGTQAITSLRKELGREIDRSRLIGEVLNALESYYGILAKDGGGAEIVDIWKTNSRMLGRAVTVTTDGSAVNGKAVDILDDGRLVVQTGRTRRLFSSGDVKVSLGRPG